MQNAGNDLITFGQPLDQQKNPVPVGCPDTGNTQSVATGSASTLFTENKVIDIIADADGYLHFHASESATTSHMPIRADQPRSFLVLIGQKIAFYSTTGGATIKITPYL